MVIDSRAERLYVRLSRIYVKKVRSLDSNDHTSCVFLRRGFYSPYTLSAANPIRPPSGPKVYGAQVRASTPLTTSLRCPRPVGSHAPGSSLGRYCCSSPCNRNNVLDYCSGSLSREALCSWGTETESNHRSALQSDRNCPAAESLISSVTHYVSARVILS